jgi:hypothetical protein
MAARILASGGSNRGPLVSSLPAARSHRMPRCEQSERAFAGQERNLLGQLLLSSLFAREYSVVLAVNLVVGIALVTSNLAVALLDPRVRLQ